MTLAIAFLVIAWAVATVTAIVAIRDRRRADAARTELSASLADAHSEISYLRAHHRAALGRVREAGVEAGAAALRQGLLLEMGMLPILDCSDRGHLRRDAVMAVLYGDAIELARALKKMPKRAASVASVDSTVRTDAAFLTDAAQDGAA